MYAGAGYERSTDSVHWSQFSWDSGRRGKLNTTRLEECVTPLFNAVFKATRQACTKSPFSHILESNVGVLFLGTPHRGSVAQKWDQVIATTAGALGFHAVDSIMNSLSIDSEALIDLVDDSVSLAKQHAIEIFCFFEQHKTDYAKGRVWGSGTLSKMVSSPPACSYRTSLIIIVCRIGC